MELRVELIVRVWEITIIVHQRLLTDYERILYELKCPKVLKFIRKFRNAFTSTSAVIIISKNLSIQDDDTFNFRN